MKKFIYIALYFILAFSCCSKSDENNKEHQFKILFLGNSYTFNHGLPEQVKAMAIDHNANISIKIKSLTPGGASLKDHLTSSFTVDTIDNGGWDAVIIQGHSLEPLKNPLIFREAALALIKIAGDAGAEIYLFETWARAPGEPEYSEEWSGRNPDVMQKLISSEYIEVAESIDATVIPVGRVWQTFIRNFPDIELYSTDGSHPTACGSYLTACVIYKYLFAGNLTELGYYPTGMNKSEAKQLRAAAENILDSDYGK